MDPEKRDEAASSQAIPANGQRGADESAAGAGERDQPTTADQFRRHAASKRQGLDDYDPEEQIWSGGYSPKAMVGTWILLALVTIAAVAAAFVFEPFTWLMAGIGLLVIWVVALLVYASRRLGVHYELTSQRFIHQSGILSRRTDRIEVIDIDDVSYHQGPVQRMFGIGTIHISSTDRSHPELSMEGIDDVKSVAGLVDDIRRTERRRRSLHIESI